MANALRRPNELSFEGNVAENWRSFEMDFDIYVAAARPDADAKTIAYTLLNLAGEEAIERSRTFVYAETESKEDPKILKQKFKELCEPRKNLIILRHRFNTRSQRPNESFQAYFVDLKNQAAACEFGEKQGEFIRDRIVCGIHSDVVRRLLLREPDLTLDRAKEMCIMHELADLDSKGINTDPDFTPSVCEIRNRKQKPNSQTNYQSKSRNTRQRTMVRDCRFCGEDHPVRKCPAYGTQCSKCDKFNHFAVVCLSSLSDNRDDTQRPLTPRKRSQNSQPLHEIDYQDDDEQEDTMQHFVIEAVDTHESSNELHITAYTSNKPFDLKIDTGAKCNVISRSTLQSLRIPHHINTSDKVTLFSYSNTKMNTLGTCELECVIANVNTILKFIVINESAKTILGLPDTIKFQLLQFHPEVHEIRSKEKALDPFNKYSSAFRDKPKHTPNTVPAVKQPKRIPHRIAKPLHSPFYNSRNHPRTHPFHPNRKPTDTTQNNAHDSSSKCPDIHSQIENTSESFQIDNSSKSRNPSTRDILPSNPVKTILSRRSRIPIPLAVMSRTSDVVLNPPISPVPPSTPVLCEIRPIPPIPKPRPSKSPS